VEALIRPVRGFASYSVIRSADAGVSVTVSQEKAGTEESMRGSPGRASGRARPLPGATPATVVEGPHVLQLGKVEAGRSRPQKGKQAPDVARLRGRGSNRRLRPAGAHVQKQRQPLPTAAAIRADSVIWQAWLTQGLDEQSGTFKRQKIALDRPMLAMECHRQPVAIDRIGITECPKVVSLDQEARIGGGGFEAAGGINGVNDGDAKPPARRKNPRDLPHRCRHGIDIVKRHEGDCQVCTHVCERKRGSVG
jgi:hypothetical protein